MDDPFSYSARWDSVGLDCSNCNHQNTVEWPNLKRDYACELHKVSLSIEVAENGYKEGEWFCLSFFDNGTSNSKSIKEFQTIKQHLDSTVLYGAYGKNKQLKEIDFLEL